GYGGYTVYFAARTSAPWVDAKLWADGTPPATATQISGVGVGAALSFDGVPLPDGDPAGAPGELTAGLSLVSIDNAAANLAAELPGFAFDKTREQTAASWDKLLSAILVEGGSELERRVFYSALYRSFLMPTVHSDVDGSFFGFDHKVGRADGYRYMSDL